MALQMAGHLAAEAGRVAVDQAKDLATKVMNKSGAKEGAEGGDDAENIVVDDEIGQSDRRGDPPEEWNISSAQMLLEKARYKDPRDKVIQREAFARMAVRLRRDFLPHPNDLAPSGVDPISYVAQRRFKAMIRAVTLANMTDDPHTVFIDFSIGGTLKESRVMSMKGVGHKPMVAGHKGHSITTHSGTVQPDMIPLDFSVNSSFEWNCSYYQLTRQKLEINLWKLNNHSVNEMLSRHEDSMLSITNGSVSQTVVLSGPNRVGELVPLFRLNFQLQFEEVYNYALQFKQFALAPTVRESSDGETAAARLRNLSGNPADPAAEPILRAGVADEEQSQLRSHAWLAGDKRLQLRIPIQGENSWPMRAAAESDGRSDAGYALWDTVGLLNFRGTATELEAVKVDFRILHKKEIQGEGSAELRNILDDPQIACEIKPRIKNDDTTGTLTGTVAIGHRPKYRQYGAIGVIDESKLAVLVKIVRVEDVITEDGRTDVNSYIEVEFEGEKKSTATVYDSSQPYFQTELQFGVRVQNLQEIEDEDVYFVDPLTVDLWGELEMCSEHLGRCYISLAEILADDGMRAVETKKYFSRTKNKELNYEAVVWHGTKKLVNIWSPIGNQYRHAVLHFEAWLKPTPPGLRLNMPPPFPGEVVQPLPDVISEHLGQCLVNWQDKTGIFRGDRNFSVVRCNQWKQERLLSTFVSPSKYPTSATDAPSSVPLTCGQIHSFVRSIPFVEVQRHDHWLSTEFFLRQRRGSVFDHVILHTSLLLGQGINAFACLGTLQHGEPFAWVMTVHFHEKLLPGSQMTGKPYRVCFWDTEQNALFEIPDALIAPETLLKFTRVQHAAEGKPQTAHTYESVAEVCEAVDSAAVAPAEFGKTKSAFRIIKNPKKLPFRTLDVIFNNSVILANIQHRDVLHIKYDFWNPYLWHSLYNECPKISEDKFDTAAAMEALEERLLPPLILRDLNFSPAEVYMSGMSEVQSTGLLRSKLYSEFKTYISKWRYAVSKLSLTTWIRNQPSVSFLECGAADLAALHREVPFSSEHAFADSEVQDWRLLLFSRTPEDHMLRWGHLHMPLMAPRLVASEVWNRFDFVRDLDKSLQLAVGFHITAYPNKIASIFAVVTALKRVKKQRPA